MRRLGRAGHTTMKWVLWAGALLAVASAVLAAEPSEAPGSQKIRDNLFLLEEAYNQEPGVVQHIQTYQRGNGDWNYTFTDEWPAPGERHQLSLTVPVQKGATGSGTQFGDVLVNYRRQLVHRETLAFAPRLSLILPTGDEHAGSGRGGLGFQGALPLSLDVHPKWALHLNAGLAYVPRAFDAAADARWGALDTTVGAALVWLPIYRINGLVEVIHQSAKEGAAGPRESTITVNPGVRAAIDFRSGLQIVPGFSVPIEFRGGERHASALFYLSFEHPMWKP